MADLETENLDIKIKLDQLNIKVFEQDDKIREIANFVRLELDRCRQEYASRIEEISIMIS
jgi:hypothetical protein